MTQLDLARVEERETERMKEPAKGWRNKWKTVKRWRSTNSGKVYLPGDFIWSKYVWPSKEIAIEMAAKNALDPKNAVAAGWLVLVDAFPVSP